MKPAERFKKELQRQLGFLKRSTDSYDTGIEDEAIRIATVIRTLFRESPVSLLTHLGAKTSLKLLTSDPHKIQLVDNSGPVPMWLVAFEALTMNGVHPKLGNGLTGTAEIPAQDWWDQIVIVIENHRL